MDPARVEQFADRTWVVRGLSGDADGAGNAGGLAGDGIVAGRIGQIVMIEQPHANAGPRRAAAAGNPGRVDVVLPGPVPDSLEAPGGVEHLHRIRPDVGQTIIHGREGDAVLVKASNHRGVNHALVAAAKAAAVNPDKQRGGPVALDQV